jgi:U4/U6 small nuclear ribonucleoprotein PRP31
MHRQMAIKRLAPKVSLAARMDLSKESREGEYGRQLRQQVLDAIDRLTEPAPNSGVRALPVPDDKPSKKRGGRKARAEKNRNAQTELRQAQNRMAFGQEEQEVTYGDESVGMGMINSGDAGRIRGFQIDERTKAKISKKNAGWGIGNTSVGPGAKTMLGGAGRATGLRTSGVNAMAGATAATGTTVLNFDQHQGLSLADPGAIEAEQRKAQMKAQDKYFEGGGFTKFGGGAGGDNPLKRKTDGEVEKDKDGFKKPALPALRRLMKEAEKKA